ncbi:hypothetical protein ACFQT0_13500 [Hymenobacter humi]|uniref:MFS transporter n=1 Tax=Hymenobacter humi TaxID=1411620 RepID=A0ABW2U4F1_9BACT
MTDADFHRAIRRIRWLHWLHYLVQALVMGSVVLVVGRRAAVGNTLEPRLATWPALLLLATLVPAVGVLLYGVYRRMQPNLRRPAEENLRIYLCRIFIRNSLLGLVGLPMLASYLITHKPFDLIAAAGMLLALSWRLAPSAQKYQRWLLS